MTKEKIVKDKKELKYDTVGRAKTVRYVTAARKARINPKKYQGVSSLSKDQHNEK